eukprot:2258559-Amphidinium_carterae.1
MCAQERRQLHTSLEIPYLGQSREDKGSTILLVYMCVRVSFQLMRSADVLVEQHKSIGNSRALLCHL